MMKKIKVLLVDDHAVVRAGFRMLLTTEPGIDVIAEAERGEMACQLYLDKRPDIVVMDLSMPGIGGLESIRRIRQREPTAKILVFSVHDEQVYIQRALTAGAQGYICKNSAPALLIEAIKTIASGKRYLENSPGDQTGAPNPNDDNHYKSVIDALSPREFDVFLLLAIGLTTQKIAEELCLGYKTVANYGTQIRSKLKVSTVAELAHIALISGVMKNSQ